MAELALITRKQVDYYESGATLVNLYTIIRIANALSVHPDWLLAWKQEETE